LLGNNWENLVIDSYIELSNDDWNNNFPCDTYLNEKFRNEIEATPESKNTISKAMKELLTTTSIKNIFENSINYCDTSLNNEDIIPKINLNINEDDNFQAVDGNNIVINNDDIISGLNLNSIFMNESTFIEKEHVQMINSELQRVIEK
jgi:hypothetical protein